MYHIIENWKITDSSEFYIKNEKWITIKYDFSDWEKEKIQEWFKIILADNWEIIFEETDEVKEVKLEKLRKKTKAFIYSKYNKEDQLTLWMKALKIVSKVLKWETLTTEDEEYQKEAEEMEVFISAEIEKYKQEKNLILNTNNDWNNL